MNIQEISVFSKDRILQSRVLERIVISLLREIPAPIGVLIRRYCYQKLFFYMGKSVSLQEGIDVLGANSITLYDEVKILQNVVLDMQSPDSYLRLNRGVVLDRGVNIRATGEHCQIDIGERTYLGPDVCITGTGHIRIGENCLISAHTRICAGNYGAFELSRKGTIIEDECWLGDGVKILDGVTIGRGSIIGTGCVVTKDIPPQTIVIAVPKTMIKESN
ncbi:MAG: acyltransferase [Leptolyngbyaceae cyanobacterium bins.302]|nr:acyltransferase [Leptolyngbyaceae cyanobacterium bins.302]